VEAGVVARRRNVDTRRCRRRRRRGAESVPEPVLPRRRGRSASSPLLLCSVPAKSRAIRWLPESVMRRCCEFTSVAVNAALRTENFTSAHPSDAVSPAGSVIPSSAGTSRVIPHARGRRIPAEAGAIATWLQCIRPVMANDSLTARIGTELIVTSARVKTMRARAERRRT
jgi:hypothetical protein